VHDLLELAKHFKGTFCLALCLLCPSACYVSGNQYLGRVDIDLFEFAEPVMDSCALEQPGSRLSQAASFEHELDAF
jgi:hypothetical protein